MLTRKIKLPWMYPGRIIYEIGDFVIDQVLRCGLTGCVIGLSGGVDSTTTAALITRAFSDYNKMHDDKLELVGYMLPSGVNNPKDTEDGIKVAERLGIRHEVQSIDKIVEAYQSTNPEALNVGYHKGNLMSRIRANVLSTKAATERKLLAGTGNKDEDFGIGYYTLFGDGAVHMSPIGALPKRLVRQIAEYLGFKDIASREPSAGLEPGQTDFKDLGYGYDVVELVIEGLEQGFSPEELVNHYQVKYLVEKQLPHSKFNNVQDVVNDVLRRHEIALAKAEIIHPPIAPVTLKYVDADYGGQDYGQEEVLTCKPH
jgi:NAD+ synthase